jgi:hypothetical protein
MVDQKNRVKYNISNTDENHMEKKGRSWRVRRSSRKKICNMILVSPSKLKPFLLGQS